MSFKKDKEYLITIESNTRRLICKKIFKNQDGTIKFIDFEDPLDPNTLCTYLPSALDIATIKEPVDNTEFFIMYTNWLNFYRDGIHQDLEFANNVKLKILNTLNDRTYVIYGSGAFVEYDLNNLNRLKQCE